MKHIWIIFKKELRLTLRDKRTMVVMILIPLLLFPGIFVIIGKIQSSSSKDEYSRALRVGYSAPADDQGLRAFLEKDTLLKVIPSTSPEQFRTLVREDSLDIAISLKASFPGNIAGYKQDSIHVWYDMGREAPYDRLKGHFEAYEKLLLAGRLDSLQLSPSTIDPIVIDRNNTASMQETFGKYAGGILPYIFIAFCYMGCMFPAIDLFTGEKERGTIETILSTPVDRWKLLAGKMMVVVASGMTTAFLSLLGLFVGLQISETLPPVVMDIILSILTPTFIGGFLLMLLPLVIFFAGTMIPATVYAKSYKEAQSILSPLNFLVITPAVVGMMPGIELNLVTALIPILNVVLATKDLIAGTIELLPYLLTLLSLLVIAFLAVVFSFKRFGNEKNILRT